MKITEKSGSGITWIDVVDPSRKDLEALAARFSLHASSVQDCLDPEHLPKHEKIENTSFVILRAFDLNADKKSDTIQGLTRKLALFLGKNFVISVHRVEQSYVSELIEQWDRQIQKDSPNIVVGHLIVQVAKTYEKGLDDVYASFEQFEEQVFAQDKKIRLHKIYLLKRRIAVMRRMLRLMLDPIARLAAESEKKDQHVFQNAKETVDKILFQLDDIHENLTALLSLQISLASQKTNEASHKTNEVMRILTIFSVFILPLNFIAGIYGMNFENMPELHSPYGYPFTLATMVITSAVIYFWFRKRGWLQGV